DSPYTHTGFAWYDSLSLARTSICAIRFSSCVTTSLIRVTPVQVFLPVVHRLRCLPRLRSRLTQSGRAFLWKPQSFGGRDSHPSCATHTGILTSIRSTFPLGLASLHIERSPTILTDPQFR